MGPAFLDSQLAAARDLRARYVDTRMAVSNSRLMRRSGLFVSLACLALASPAIALDWPRWRGPEMNGISKEKSWTTVWPKEGPKQLWKANVGMGLSSVSASEGSLYTMGNKDDGDTVYCFDATTGKEVWKHTYAEPLDPRYYEGGTSCTPTGHSAFWKISWTLSALGEGR